MGLRNTRTAYGSVAKAFHWLMFLILTGLVIAGYYMNDLPADTPAQVSHKIDIYGLHKSFGLLILLLVILRLGWRRISPPPALPAGTRRLERLSAGAVHGLLYLFMVVQPLSGWLMSSFGGNPVRFFGFQMPALVGKDKTWGGLTHEVHEIVAQLLIAAFVVHVAAALFHHFVRKDDILRRMSPGAGRTD